MGRIDHFVPSLPHLISILTLKSEGGGGCRKKDKRKILGEKIVSTIFWDVFNPYASCLNYWSKNKLNIFNSCVIVYTFRNEKSENDFFRVMNFCLYQKKIVFFTFFNSYFEHLCSNLPKPISV